MPQRLQIPKWPPGAPKWPTGSGKGSHPRLSGAPNNFRKIGFVIRALLLWKKFVTEKKKWKKVKKRWKLRYTNVVASRPSVKNISLVHFCTFGLIFYKKGFLNVSAIYFAFYKGFIKPGSSWFVLRLSAWSYRFRSWFRSGTCFGEFWTSWFRSGTRIPTFVCSLLKSLSFHT